MSATGWFLVEALMYLAFVVLAIEFQDWIEERYGARARSFLTAIVLLGAMVSVGLSHCVNRGLYFGG